MANRFTIVGGRGFIGNALAAFLRERGHDVRTARHDDDPSLFAPLGHVLYCSGIAASVPQDASLAFAMHVGGVQRFLSADGLRSLLFLSSTRVYGASEATAETAPLEVRPFGGADVYRISKIAGEALCLAHAQPSVRVARLSNVAGPSFRSTLFISDVLAQAARTGRADVRTARASAKDYIGIGDVCRYLAQIAERGRERLYNVAFGANVTNGEIVDGLAALGVDVHVSPDAVTALTPSIDARRLHGEFGPPSERLLEMLPDLLARFRRHFSPVGA